MKKMAIQNSLLAAALLSLALASGCAKGGSGPCVNNCTQVKLDAVSNGIPGINEAPVGVTINLTATVTGTSSPNVNWAITGTSCSGTGNPCGSFTSTTGTTATYQAPSAIPSTPQFTITATSQSDSTGVGSLDFTIVPITTAVAPPQLTVGIGLTQQFAAVALPDNAPQSFTWTCTAGGSNCANFTQDPNISGLAYYKPVAGETCGTNCVQISAASTSDPTGCSFDTKKYPCTIAKATAVSSRLTGNGNKSVQFAYKFSGYDNNGKQVLAAGTFSVTNNAVGSGVEDLISWNGSKYVTTQRTISGGSYAPITGSDVNSNNSGTLTLTGASPNKFQVVLNAGGDIQMIESDGQGTGSGVAEPVSSNNNFNSGTNQTFAFGFTGLDSSFNRVGYAGVMPIPNIGVVNGGKMDINDNGSTSNVCGAAPCTIAGSFNADGGIANLWHLTLTSAVTMHFDFFLANGQVSTGASNPLTIYAISTDTVDTTHPTVLGTMMFQDPTPTYDKTTLNGTSVSALTGANANVSLTLGTTDGNGNIAGQFDQNNGGTILASAAFPPTGTNNYTYAADSGGRYTINLLGDPTATTPVAPIPFVLYASGANRGFLLDQSSSAVFTGAMTPQKSPPKNVGGFAAAALPGTYAVATNSCSASGTNTCNASSLAPLSMNLLLTSPGSLAFKIAGTQNPGSQPVSGNYAVDANGVGTFVLTAPAATNYTFYSVDLTDFYMIQTDKNALSPILFVSQ